MITLRRTVLVCAALAALHANAAPLITASLPAADGPRFLFSEPMLTWQGGDIVPATITPPLPCTWEWLNDRELKCRTADDIKPQLATRYTVHFTGGLPARSGAVLAPMDVISDFEPPFLVAFPRGWRDGRPTIDLASNVPIDPASIHETLLVQADGGEVLPFELTVPPREAQTPVYAHRLRLPPIAGTNRTITIWLDAGLRSTAGSLRGQARDEPLIVARFDEPFRLREMQCSQDRQLRKWTSQETPLGCSPGATIALFFSRELDDAFVKAFAAGLPPSVSIEPAEPAPHDADALRDMVRISIDQPNAATWITLPATLRAASGEALEPLRVLIETNDKQPPAPAHLIQSAVQAVSR